MSELYIKTTQNVPLFFTPASIGERMLGYAIDVVIQAAYAVSMFYILRFTGVIDLVMRWDAWSQRAFVLLVMSPIMLYSLICESMMEGRTFGKKLVKTKVVKIDGYQASFGDYFIRWIFRLVDIDLGYIPGLLSMLFTKHTQRLGDLAAGTAVISEKSKYNISHTILADIGEEYTPFFAQSQILRFNDNDMRVIKENAAEAIKHLDYFLLDKLTFKLEEVMQIKNPYPTQREFIQKVLEDYNYYTGK